MNAANHSDISIMEELLHSGANPYGHTTRNITPLMIAVLSEDSEKRVKILLTAGADPNTVSVGGYTAIDLSNRYHIALKGRGDCSIPKSSEELIEMKIINS